MSSGRLNRRDVLGGTGALLLLTACGGGGDSGGMANGGMGGGGMPGYVATSLITDTSMSSNPYAVANVDAHLVNPWGIAFNPQGFVWVADNGTSTATLYDGNGAAQSLVVAIPAGSAGAAKPTGIVFNGTQSFAITQGGLSGTSLFIFVGESGTIAGWSPGVDMTHAVTVHDNAPAGSIYKGLAIGSSAGSDRLFAADFHNAKVDVFGADFAKVTTAGGFADPNLPAGYAPFGIQVIGGVVYVAYAKQDAQAVDETPGAGLGLIDTFDTDGHLLKRLIAPGGVLNAPWGMAMAPADFGMFSGALLVGNLGDGRLHAFDPSTGALLGTLARPDGTPLAIDGLWGIAFGNGINAQPANTLFFAAGPSGGTHGVYGRIDAH
jgi:uncharacterized protein (TIGR03118 family)